MTDLQLTFWEHVEELRSTLIKALSVIFLGTVCTLFFFPSYYDWIISPLKSIESERIEETFFVSQMMERVRVKNTSSKDQIYFLPQGAVGYQNPETSAYHIPGGGYLEYDRPRTAEHLLLLSPGDGLVTMLRLSLWTGLMATSPIWLYFILKFISPALGMRQKRLIFPFLAASLCSMAAGAALSFFVTIPLANSYLARINQNLGQNAWVVPHYIDYTILLLFANALAFELSVLLLFLVHYGVISHESLRQHWRGAYVTIFILSALLTPPDVLTLFLLAIPLIGIYEGTIFYGFCKQRSREARIAKGNY